ncbi:hypothetical protein GQ457_13G002020 [Hibiscus cannabinus]
MESRDLVFVSILVAVLVLSISAVAEQDNSTENYSPAEDYHQYDDVDDSITIAEGRLLLQKKRSRKATCNKFPGICRAKGSPGPQCCKKKCVNVLRDRQNCGKCGKKCKYNETCCKGKCVNPSFNTKHCGGCNNRCGNGEFCVFGLCNYA